MSLEYFLDDRIHLLDDILNIQEMCFDLHILFDLVQIVSEILAICFVKLYSCDIDY